MSTAKVVPGAAPAMARAGVGGYIHKYIYICIYIYVYMYICIFLYNPYLIQILMGIQKIDGKFTGIQDFCWYM
jgi:hypothetical protein